MEQLTPDELKELNSSDLLRLMYSLHNKAAKLGSDWAEAKQEASKFKELIPHELSVRICEQIKENPDMRMNHAKAEAMSSLNYKASIERMIESEKRARLLEVEYRGCMKSLDALSSISYVRNSELKLGI